MKIIEKIKMNIEYLKMDKRDVSNTFDNIEFIPDMSRLIEKDNLEISVEDEIKIINNIYDFINDTNK